MSYHFKEEYFDKACGIWRSDVLEYAKVQPGFVRMQFLTSGTRAMAIGTWKDQSCARKFMETGVFTKLMEKLEDMVTERPEADGLGT